MGETPLPIIHSDFIVDFSDRSSVSLKNFSHNLTKELWERLVFEKRVPLPMNTGVTQYRPHPEQDLCDLHAGVLARPDDNNPRLVYADRLEELTTSENGYDRRAEFIRVQIELSQLLSGENPPVDLHRITWLERREFELYDDDLACPLMLPNDQKVCSVFTDRQQFDGYAEDMLERFHCLYAHGFVEEVRGPLSLVEKYLPEVVKGHPVLKVGITDLNMYGLTHTFTDKELDVISGILLKNAREGRVPPNYVDIGQGDTRTTVYNTMYQTYRAHVSMSVFHSAIVHGITDQ